MILRRIGRKTGATADAIIRAFPPFHTWDVYYEPFFGAGSIFWQIPTPKFTWANDLDGEVFNLWTVATHYPDALHERLYIMPLDETLFQHWMEHTETDMIMRAVRFIMLSNFSIYGKGDCFLTQHNSISKKEEMLKLVKLTYDRLQRVIVRGLDFREFFAAIYVSDNHIPKAKRFIYADPPYLDTTNPYNTPAWSIQDTNDLLDTLLATGIRFAVSEFNHPDVVQAATDRGLTVLELGDRRAITSEQKKTDILIINYPKPLFKQLEIGMDHY